MFLTMQNACSFGLDTLAALITRAFTGYISGDVVMHDVEFARMCAADDIDLSLSQVILRDSVPAGLALIARRGWTSRVAAFGIVPEQQGQGLGKWLMSELIAQARARGDHGLTLEVIEQNERAVRLYQGMGMHPLRRLVGFLGDHLPGQAAALHPIDPYEVARRISAWQPIDLPWQCTGETLAKCGAPCLGFHLDETAFALITEPEAETIVIRGLAVAPSRQRQGGAARMVSALLAAYPDKRWRVIAICPEAYAGIFRDNGFTQERLNQFQMWMTL
jgi:GNAT superfamily N-acetyltransferase